jgi:quercetin dioxygenase-like cupin family protein
MKKQAIDPAATEIEKAKPCIIVKISEYLPHSIVSRTILKKATGNIIVSSFDEGEELEEKTYPFDTFIQIIDGVAEISIDKKPFRLSLGDGIVIPAHAPHCFNANEPFKMISTTIKSSYEE